jgi:PKD repeat protein
MTSNRASGRIALVVLALVAGTLLPAASADAAPTWLPPYLLSDGVADSITANVAVNAKGDAIAVWAQGGPSLSRVLRAAFRPVGGSWGAPFDVSDPTLAAWSPDVAIDDAGNATVVWRHLIGANSQLKVRTRSATGVWSAIEQPVSLGQEFGTVVAVDPGGATTLAWFEQGATSSTNQIWTVQRPAGGAWQAPEPQSPLGQVFDPVLSANAGVVALAWRERTTGLDRVRSRIRSPDGSWSSPLDLSAAGLDATDSRIVVDSAGEVTAAWSLLIDSSHVVAQAVTRTAAGVWGTVQDVSAADESAGVPELAVDAAGRATLAWGVSFPDGTFVVKTASRPAGGSWSAPETVSGADTQAGGPIVAADATGSAVIIWTAFVGAQEFIRASRRPPGGSFGEGVSLVPPGPLGVAIYDVGMDSAGNAVAVTLSRIGSHDVVNAVGLDAEGPAVTGFTVPSTGKAGTALSYIATATDSWSAVSSYTWSFGDGTSLTGPNVSHTYAQGGTYTVTLTVADAVGNTTTRTATTTVAPPVPAIGTFRLTRNKIQALTRTVAKKTKLKVGLNTPSTLKLVFKSKHRHLVNGKHKRIRIVLRKQLPAGLSRIAIKARLKGKLLKPDTYVITGTARNSSGTSPKKKAKLKVVR